MKNLLLGLGLIMSVCVQSQQVARGLTASNGTFIGFYEYKPTDYSANPTTKYPVIIFLHGIGERGNGTTELSRVMGNAIPKYINAGHKMRFFWNGKWETFLVLSPQLSNGYGWWQTWYVDEMINYAKANLRIDTNRIILTGLSLGGGGVWGYSGASLSNSQKLSAIGACCPTCEGPNWCNINGANLPTWAFHATNDGTIPWTCTNGAVTAIGNCGGPVKPYLTLFSSGGHFIWDAAFDTTYNNQNPNIYEWFLGQDKSLPVNIRPRANAGNNLTISTSPGTVTLNASGSTDQDGTLVRYIWRKIAGPSFGNIQTPVTTNGRTTVLNLLVPGTFQFEVKAVDDRADYHMDTVTVTVVSGAVSNIAPIALAGPDRSTDISITNLDGTNTYDPDGTTVNYSWSKLTGPPSFTLSSSTVANPTVSDLLVGTYTFQLRATDALGAVSLDTVQVNSSGFPLPVKLRFFKAANTEFGTKLSWATEREYNNDQFIVERSTDGSTFTPIGSQKGEKESYELREYTLMDNQAAAGVVYYRLRQVSVDGRSSYLQTITVTVPREGGPSVQYFPNPVRNSLTVQVMDKQTGVMKINLYSLDGRLIKQKQLFKQDEHVSVGLDIRDLSRGVYMLEVTVDDKLKETMKVIKQ